MQIREHEAVCLSSITTEEIIFILEHAARTCYQSYQNEGTNSERFLKSLWKRGHESIFEHVSLTFQIQTDRGVTHELVRHRLCSFSQESTRYCNYKDGINVIKPVSLSNAQDSDLAYIEWYSSCLEAETHYKNLLEAGTKPEIARSVLPTCLKTSMVITANIREWMHIFNMRITPQAHPDCVWLVSLIAREFIKKVPFMLEFMPTLCHKHLNFHGCYND